MSHQPCAIVGIGQTHHKKARRDVSYGGLAREAASRALADEQQHIAALGLLQQLFRDVDHGLHNS